MAIKKKIPYFVGRKRSKMDKVAQWLTIPKKRQSIAEPINKGHRQPPAMCQVPCSIYGQIRKRNNKKK